MLRILAWILLGGVALSVVSTQAGAAELITQDQFPPKTTGELIQLCSAGKEDPLVTAAVNFCEGFAEGVVEVALSYQAVTRANHQPFCLPTPRPSHDEALTKFVLWANANPDRLEEKPVVGLIRFLISEYPCPHHAARRSAG